MSLDYREGVCQLPLILKQGSLTNDDTHKGALLGVRHAFHRRRPALRLHGPQGCHDQADYPADSRCALNARAQLPRWRSGMNDAARQSRPGLWMGLSLASAGGIAALKVTDAIDSTTGCIFFAAATGLLIPF